MKSITDKGNSALCLCAHQSGMLATQRLIRYYTGVVRYFLSGTLAVNQLSPILLSVYLSASVSKEGILVQDYINRNV